MSSSELMRTVEGSVSFIHSTSALHRIRASLKDMLSRRLVNKLESVSTAIRETPSFQNDEAHTRLDQAVWRSHSEIIYPSGLQCQTPDPERDNWRFLSKRAK